MRLTPGIVLFLWIMSNCVLYAQQNTSLNPSDSLEESIKKDSSNNANALVLSGLFPWDDPIQPLHSTQTLSPEEQDCVTARALFATARDMERRSELYESWFGPNKPESESEQSEQTEKKSHQFQYSEHQKSLLAFQALQNYQRVARLDPSTIVSIRIVEMACLQERYDLANRYVEEMFRLNQPITKIEPMLLRQLAVGLAGIGAYEDAYRLYKPILQNIGSRLDAQAFVLNFEGARYAYLSEDYKQAADSFEYVYRIAKNPDEFGIAPRLIDLLKIEKADTLRLVADAFLMDNRYERSELFFEMADKLDSKPAVLLYNKARIAIAKKDFQTAHDLLYKSLEGDLSIEGDEPFRLLFDIAGKRGEIQYAEAKLKALVDKVEQKIVNIEKQIQHASGKKFRLERINKILTDMDYSAWYFYSTRLHEQNKTEEAITRLTRLYAVKPNNSLLRLIVQYHLEQKRFADVFNILAEQFKTTGNIGIVVGIVSDFLKDESSYKAYLESAKQLQQEQKNTWTEYHSAAVAITLMSVFESKTEPNQATDPNDKQVQPPESKEIADIRLFVDYAFAHAKNWVEEKNKKAKQKDTVLSKMQMVLAGKDKTDVPSGAFNGQALARLWGGTLLTDSQYTQSVEALERGLAWCATREEKDWINFYLSGAKALLRQDKAAMELIDSCLKNSPNEIDFLNRKAWLLYLADKFDESEALYTDILNRFRNKFDDEYVRNSLSETRSSLAGMYDRRVTEPNLDEQKRLEYQQKSEELLEQVLDEYPGDIGAMNDLAYFWSERGVNLHRAERMSRRTVEEAPDNAAYADTLGWIYFKQKKYDEAIKIIEHSLELFKDAGVYDHLGDIYVQMNQQDQAVEAWKKALDILKDPEKVKLYPHLKDAIEKKLNSVHPPSA